MLTVTTYIVWSYKVAVNFYQKCACMIYKWECKHIIDGEIEDIKELLLPPLLSRCSEVWSVFL